MAQPLEGRLVVLGIAGSIAAYKGAEVARRLMDLGADVHATLTAGGEEFITALTLRTLTGNPVTTDMFDNPEEWEVRHVSLARRAAAVVIAPASANAIAKLAHGLADEFIYTVVLATEAPVFVAPAMNDRMYSHEAVQQNLARLRDRGVHIMEPEHGRLACGTEGLGRLAEPEYIASFVAAEVAGTPAAGSQRSEDLAGVRVVITAGPTREPLDPVRFISNRSSGKMGYALGAAALRRGADVTLVSGPASSTPPAGAEVISVETTRQMYDAVMERLSEADVVIGAAAPADYSPQARTQQKLKKEAAGLTLRLQPTPDIMAECGRRKTRGKILVGFAAETENVIDNARAKLSAKGLDMIVANDVSVPGIGFDSDRNAGHLVLKDGRVIELAPMDKSTFAERVLDAVAESLRARLSRRARRNQ